ncbi:Dyp-type peroxidase [Microlunatus ginsengisoli]|uniref:Dyp-type peroxidase n=1 Tax=Microlunatus ginsengisoli TaxID=363863 RepID=A0ABP7AV41_9ACTN
MTASRSSIGRRAFLAGTVAAAGAVAAGPAAWAADPTERSGPERVPFTGEHQAGIVEEARPAAAFASFDVTARDKAELGVLMQRLTDRARALTDGAVPTNPGIATPPMDAGLLGPEPPAGRLTVTVGVGASLFDHRYALTALKPRRLRPMDTFADDDLDPAQCHGDLLLQLCADSHDVVLNALRDLTRSTRGLMQPRWRINGFRPAPRPDGAARNLMGFKDGTANPDPADAAGMDRLVWIRPDGGEPAWTVGGSYLVVRTIRMLVEFWDRVGIGEQERMLGRRKDTGAPLSGSVETDLPDYSDDPTGAVTPLDSHIRMANPRTSATDGSRLLRRAYNYDRGIDVNGNLDMGLLFTCFQQDLDRQFVTVQKRLAGEPLVDYISPVGGGYFLALPGVTDERDSYASGLLS